MGVVWELYGTCIGVAWELYGSCMGVVWEFETEVCWSCIAVCVGDIWKLYLFLRGCKWGMRVVDGNCTGIARELYGCCRETCIWELFGGCMGVVYGSCMRVALELHESCVGIGVAWELHGICMGLRRLVRFVAKVCGLVYVGPGGARAQSGGAGSGVGGHREAEGAAQSRHAHAGSVLSPRATGAPHPIVACPFPCDSQGGGGLKGYPGCLVELLVGLGRWGGGTRGLEVQTGS